MTDRLIPDDAVFLFIFKAWSPRIASSYVKGFHKGKKTSSGDMRLFGNRLRRLTETDIPDCAGFLFVFKAWSLRIVNYVKASTTPKTSKKTRKVV